MLCVFAQNTVRDLTVHQLSKEELVSVPMQECITCVHVSMQECMHGIIFSQELRRSRILSKNAEKAKRELEDISKGLMNACMYNMYTCNCASSYTCTCMHMYYSNLWVLPHIIYMPV